MKAIRLKTHFVLQLLAAVTFIVAHNLLKRGGLHTMPLAFGVVDGSLDEKIEKSLGELTKRFSQLDEVVKGVEKNRSDYEAVTKLIAEVQKAHLDLQKRQLEIRATRQKRGGEVSDDCAKFVGAVYLMAAIQQGKVVAPEESQAATIERWSNVCRSIIGKTALTTTDIPLPQQFSGEVVELVSEYGSARRYGTIFPMGAGTVKLPKLKTSPAFGLVAISNGGAEKSPQIEFVTFTASKWGGLIRLPAEIDEDSIVAMGQFLARYAAREMALIEDTVFWLADGSGTYDSLSGILKQFDAAASRVVLGSGETNIGAADLDEFRAMRPKVAATVLRRGKYFFHPSIETMLVAFNSSGDTPYIANGTNGARLDGFMIEWVDVLPAYSTSPSVSQVWGAFGDPSFTYLGLRGGMRLDTSKEAGFTTDEILVRALERFTIGHMATNHMAVIKNAAS